MRRLVAWIFISIATLYLLHVQHSRRGIDSLVRGYVSICPGDTRNHVLALMGSPTLETHTNLHIQADYEFRYTVWLPWPNQWVVGFRGNIVVGKKYVQFPSWEYVSGI
jgi:hypothetical protein